MSKTFLYVGELYAISDKQEAKLLDVSKVFNVIIREDDPINPAIKKIICKYRLIHTNKIALVPIFEDDIAFHQLEKISNERNKSVRVKLIDEWNTLPNYLYEVKGYKSLRLKNRKLPANIELSMETGNYEVNPKEHPEEISVFSFDIPDPKIYGIYAEVTWSVINDAYREYIFKQKYKP